MPRSAALKVVIGLFLLVAGCNSSTGPSQDLKLRDVFTQGVESAPVGMPLDMARLLGVANGNVALIGPFGNKDAGYGALFPGFSTSKEALWAGSGGGAVLLVSTGETFDAWFGVPDDIVDLSCLGSDPITLTDHTFTVMESAQGHRYLTVAGVACRVLGMFSASPES